MITITDDDRDAINAALIALEDVALILEGREPNEIGVPAEVPGALQEAERLRGARRVLFALRERMDCELLTR